MGIHIGELVLASGLPVLEAVIMCLFGAIMAWQEIIRQDEWRILTKMNYFVFFPSLIIASLSSTVTGQSLLSGWPIVASAMMNVALGFLCGLAVFPIVGMPVHLRPHFISCAGVGNLGNLLLVLIPSIAAKSTLFNEQDAEDGVAYIFTALYAVAMAAFTACGYLLRPRERPEKPPKPPIESPSHMHAPNDEKEDALSFVEPIHSVSLNHSRDLERHSTHSVNSTHDRSRRARHACAAEHTDYESPRRRTTEPPMFLNALFMHHYSVHSLTLDGAEADNSLSGCLKRYSTKSSAAIEEFFESAKSREDDVITTAAVSVPMVPVPQPVPDCSSKGALSESGESGIRQHAPAEQASSQLENQSVVSGEVPVQNGQTVFSVPEGQSARPKKSYSWISKTTNWFPQRFFSSAAGETMHTHEGERSSGEQPGCLKRMLAFIRRVWIILRGILNVPTIAIMVGLVIACTPALRQVLQGPDGDPPEGEEKEKGKLDVIARVLSRVGGAAVPTLMITLGGALSKGPGDSKVSTRAIVALLAIRLVILPALGGWLVLAGQSAKLWEDNGKMFTLVMLMQQAMPTAMNVHAVAAMHGNNEKVIAGMLFWQYVSCVVTIPVCALIFLSRL